MLTKLSVKKPYSVIVAVVIIVLLGIAAFTGIRTDLLPDVDYPYALIVTEYKDASPEEVEKTVTQPIEKSLATIGKVVSVDSVSTAGRSVVTVEFDPSVNMDSVVAELREAFEPLRAEWGSSISSPLIRKINPDTMPVIVASIDVEGQDAYEISMFTEETLMGHLEGIDGVADLTVEGLVSEHVQITIDPEKLAAVNAEIFAAIGGDYEKARAALEAADAELGSASSQMSSELLNETASIDAQLRTLNDQLAKAKGNEAYSNSNIEDIKKRIKALEEEYIVYAEDPDLTEEEEERKAELEQELAAERAALAAAEEDLGGDNEEIASLEKQIAALEARRADLVAQMTTAESELAKSRADITDQLNELATAEEAAKAEADLENLITPEMVGTMLDAQNFSSTAGSLALGNKEYDVKVGDEITSLDELNQLVLFHFDLEGVDDVLLSDVANVEVVNNSNEIYSRINGHDGVVISFFKQSDHSTAETAANIWEVFDTIEERYPSVTITVLSDQSVYIDNVSGAVVQNLILGAILAVLVLMLFLRDFRPTLVVAASIPVSLMFAVALMYFTGVTMNIFSLAGLALGVGMLVDNSIVVMENIYRCRTVGLPRRDAAVKGAKQVTAALISSTLTTMCVFVPVLFTDGLSRQLFSDIGLTIAYALLASLIIAFTLVPAMAAGVLRNMDHKESVFGTFVKEKYRAILRWVLCHRVFILCFAVLMLVFCGYFAIARGTSFLPESESSEMTLTVTMEENASTEVLWETTDQIVDILLNMDDVKSVGAVADSGGMITSGGVSEGNATVIYVVLEDRKKNSCAAIEDMVLLQAAELGCDIDVSVGSYDLSSLYEEGVSITVSGRDLDVLASITADMGDLLLSVEGLENVKSSVDTATPTLKVSVNKTEAMKYGLTVSEVYDFIARSIRNSANATTLSDMDTDVIVIDGGASDLELVDIQNLKMPVENEDGTVTSVSIASIATISEEAGAPVIYRDDQVRYMTATADVTEGYNVGLVSEEVDELIAGYVPPEGYRISLSGEEAVIDSSLSDLLFLLALAFLLIYLILVAQFQSLLTPLIIMLSVPLSFTGGFLALLISGRDISIIAMVGFLLLSGIVVNNGIVLVDYINRLRRSGRVMSEAVIEGACIRLRPILMTATTTILAIMTLAFGMGVGAEVVQPMAIVVFGGMIFAVFVTLFVIPGVYDLLLRRKEDTAEELARGYHLNDPEEDESVTMEKRDSAKQAEESPEDNAEDEEDTEEEKPKKTGFFARLKAKFNDDEEEEESAEDEEDDEEEDLDKKPRFRFFRRRDEEYEEDDEDDEEDEEEDDEDEEKPRFRFFRRRTVEEDEDEDEEEDEDDDDEDEEVTPRRRFGFSLFRRKNREEDEEEDDEDDDDEDYYGIRERHPRS